MKDFKIEIKTVFCWFCNGADVILCWLYTSLHVTNLIDNGEPVEVIDLNWKLGVME